MKKKANTNFTPEFRNFAESVNLKIQANKVENYSQEKHVNHVFNLENYFKNALQISSPERLADVYLMFVAHIKHEVDNILSAQSFFREKKKEFNKISRMIKNGDAQGLIEFHINYNMIGFIRANWGGPLPAKAQKIYNNFIQERQVLIENNVPLAINRALLFYRKTREASLSLMDLINICIIGLTVGIDKYSGPYSRVWRAVCIGRMTGFMIKEYSTTFIKLYPSDQKILYRANMLKYRLKIEDLGELTIAVNESFEEDRKKGMSAPKKPVTKEDIEGLMNAAHYYSIDTTSEGNEDDDEDLTLLDQMFTQDDGGDLTDIVEKRDLLYKLANAMARLELMQRKVVKLKGVNL